MPQTSDEATVMTERIVARLAHANSAVVLTVIKVLLYLMNYIDSKASNDYLCKKMGPPLGNQLSFRHSIGNDATNICSCFSDSTGVWT